MPSQVREVDNYITGGQGGTGGKGHGNDAGVAGGGGMDPPFSMKYFTGGTGGLGGESYGAGTGGAGGYGMGPSLIFDTRAGGNFTTDSPQNQNRGIDILHRAAALEAIHDSAESYPQPRCHPETRTKMLEDLRAWALDPNPETTILWLYGPAGAGKSAIMLTLARQLQDVGRLGGSFIFKRGHATRGNAKTLFATLAYQLALNVESLRTPISRMMENEPSIVEQSIASPRTPISRRVEKEPSIVEQSIVSLRTPIARMVENEPSIVEQSIATQMQKLISEPCSAREHRDPVVIVIDGLDECEGHNIQEEILCAIRNCSDISLRFIVATRPEPHIREILDSVYAGNYRSFNVEQSFGDVRKFLRDEFSRIHREHHTMAIVPSPWPSPEVLEYLVQKSSGYFIYASTAIKFIDDKNYRPTQRLAMFLDGSGMESDSAFDALDHLYLTILCSAPRQSELIPILCAIVNFDLNTWTIDLVLGYADKDTRLLLRGLHSLLNVPPDDGDPISSYHASFPDFLNNSSRSQNFYVGTLHRRMDLARSLLTLCARQYQTEWLRLSGPRSLKHNLIPFIISLPPSAELCSLIGNMNHDYISALDFDKGRMVSWLTQIPTAPQDLLKVWEDQAHMPSIELHDGGSAKDLPSLSSTATGVVSDGPNSSPHVVQHSGDAVSDRSSSFLEEEGPQSTTFTPNMITQAEPVAGSSDRQISTFVVFMPDSVFHANDPTAVRREDASFLEEFVTDGGNCCSIHRSVEAENWIEHNYDGTLLKSLRSIGLGGPIATMLSTEIPALAIFGSILDNRVLQLAQTLSHLSALPVVIRPVADNPVTMFSQLTGSDAGLRGEPENDCETDDGSEFEGPSSESESGVNDSNDEADLSTEDPFRPRGGATREDMNIDASDEIDPNGIRRPGKGVHRTNIDLHLHLDENCVYHVEIASETMFKFQTDTAETADPVTEYLTRPQVLSCVDLKVEVKPHQVVVDRSYSNLGFLVHQSKYIAGREYLSRGFEQPSAKATRGTQTSTQTTGSFAAGLANMKPTVTVTGSQSHTTGATVQLADDKPVPPCHVKEQVGNKWDSEGKCYSSYDVAWHPMKVARGLPHDVNIRFGMGIKFYGNPERYISKLPKMSHILRNQIILWINDPGLKAKVCGMIVHTTTYIPDLKISEPRSIAEDRDVVLNRPEEPPATDTAASLDHDAANSLAIGLIEKPKETVQSGMRKLIQKFAPKSFRQKSKKPDLIDLHLHEYVARGWDQTNKMWRNIVWPTLDTNELCDAPPGLSAVWNLGLNSGPDDGFRAVEVMEQDNPHEAMPLNEHGDPELTRPINHPAIADSGTESESSASASNVGGVQVALGMAGGSSDSGSEHKRFGKQPALVEITP